MVIPTTTIVAPKTRAIQTQTDKWTPPVKVVQAPAPVVKAPAKDPGAISKEQHAKEMEQLARNQENHRARLAAQMYGARLLRNRRAYFTAWRQHAKNAKQ